MMDGFEEMLSKKNKHLNYKYYWGYGDMGTSKFTIHDYLKTFNDKSLLELEGWNMHDAKKHPSKKGHQIFADELKGFLMKFTKYGVRYWFDTFSHLKPFDVLSCDEVVELYLKNHELLGKDRVNVGGWNEKPINSSTDKIERGGFWSGYPKYFNIDPTGKKVTRRMLYLWISMV